MIRIKKIYRVKVLAERSHTTKVILPEIYKYIIKGTYVKIRQPITDIVQTLIFYCDSYEQAMQCMTAIENKCPRGDWTIVKFIKPKYVLRFDKTNDFN